MSTRVVWVVVSLAVVFGQPRAQLGSVGSGGGGPGGGGEVCAPVPAGLVGWWRADGSTLDATGRNPGTLFGGGGYEPGVVGQAFSCDGVDDGVFVGDPPELILTESLSIEAWILVRGFPSSSVFRGHIVVRSDDSSTSGAYFLSTLPNGRVTFGFVGRSRIEVQAAIAVNRPVHVAGVLDDATGFLSLYLDGQLVATRWTWDRPTEFLRQLQGPGVSFGSDAPTSWAQQPFYGSIDEVAIYNRALTASEVAAIHKAGPFGKCDEPATVSAFGAGCAGSGGSPMIQPAAGSAPALGEMLTLELSNLPGSPLNAAFGILGSSNTQWAGLSLPHDLGTVGMPGCQLLVAAEVVMVVQNVGGSATWMIPTPVDSELAGGDYFAQALVLDPGANATGAVVSNAVVARMGY